MFNMHNIHVEKNPSGGHNVYLIRSATPQKVIHHYPWFIILSSNRPREIDERIIEIEEIENAIGLEHDEVRRKYQYSNTKVWRVKCRYKSDVKQIAEKYKRQGYRVGLYNINYTVRVSHDHDITYFTDYPIPLVFDFDYEDFKERVVKILSKKYKILVFDTEFPTSGTIPALGTPPMMIQFSILTSFDDIYDPEFLEKVMIIENEALKKGSLTKAKDYAYEMVKDAHQGKRGKITPEDFSKRI